MTTRTQRAALTGSSLALLLTLSHAANDAFTNILPVFLPILQDRFSLGEAALATFVAVISISSNVLQPVMGAVSDRWGRRRSAALGLIIGSVLMSFLAVVPSVPLLFVLLAIGGLGSAIYHPSAVSMARSVGERKGLSVAFFTSGGPLGSAVAPLVVLAVIREFGIEYVPWLAVVGVVLGVLLWVYAPQQAKVVGKERPKLFDLNLLVGPVGLLAAAGIMRSLAFISFTNAMPLWLVNVKGFAADAPVIGWTLFVYGAAAAAGVLLSGGLEEHLGRRFLITGSMVVALPLLLGTLFMPPGSFLYYLLVALAGAFTNAAIPLLVVSAQDLAPHAVASASGMLMGFTWGIAGVIYIGFGALQEAVGITPALGVSYLFLVPAALLALYVLSRHRGALSA